MMLFYSTFPHESAVMDWIPRFQLCTHENNFPRSLSGFQSDDVHDFLISTLFDHFPFPFRCLLIKFSPSYL